MKNKGLKILITTLIVLVFCAIGYCFKIERTPYKAQVVEKIVVGRFEPQYYLLWKNLETGYVEQEKSNPEEYTSVEKGKIYIRQKISIKWK